MTFEEWWEREDRVYLNEYSTFKMVAAQAWEEAFDEGVKWTLQQDANALNKLQLTMEKTNDEL